ncbi:hypothetical protein ONZ45_g13492 [Pleurotus djamor]|nr:hypothetical protein ONZ45_g13492 [Pleurotus djamor]
MHFKSSSFLALVVVFNASSTIGAPIGSLRRDALEVARFPSAETANPQNDASRLQGSNRAHRRRQSSDTASIPVTPEETVPVTTGEGEGDSSAPTTTSDDGPVPTDSAPEGSTTPPDGTTDSASGGGESASDTSSVTTPTEGFPDGPVTGNATQTESPSAQVTSPVVPVDVPPSSDSLPPHPPPPASGAGNQRPPFPFGPGGQATAGGPSRPKSRPNGPSANFRGPWAFRRPQMVISNAIGKQYQPVCPFCRESFTSHPPLSLVPGILDDVELPPRDQYQCLSNGTKNSSEESIDPLYGHERIAKLCLRFIRHIFNVPGQDDVLAKRLDIDRSAPTQEESREEERPKAQPSQKPYEPALRRALLGGLILKHRGIMSTFYEAKPKHTSNKFRRRKTTIIINAQENCGNTVQMVNSHNDSSRVEVNSGMVTLRCTSDTSNNNYGDGTFTNAHTLNHNPPPNNDPKDDNAQPIAELPPTNQPVNEPYLMQWIVHIWYWVPSFSWAGWFSGWMAQVAPQVCSQWVWPPSP